jgi:hypothetical protein
VYVKKTLLHGGDTKTCTKKEESKTQATEIKILTATMGKTKSNRIGNTHITEELRMEDIQNQMEGNRLRRFGYAKRMAEHRIPKTLLQMKMTEKTPRGRPWTQWLDQDNRNIERKGQS